MMTAVGDILGSEHFHTGGHGKEGAPGLFKEGARGRRWVSTEGLRDAREGRSERAAEDTSAGRSADCLLQVGTHTRRT
jgi:hypothetical protein